MIARKSSSLDRFLDSISMVAIDIDVKHSVVLPEQLKVSGSRWFISTLFYLDPAINSFSGVHGLSQQPLYLNSNGIPRSILQALKIVNKYAAEGAMVQGRGGPDLRVGEDGGDDVFTVMINLALQETAG